jgi:hypothetical protein
MLDGTWAMDPLNAFAHGGLYAHAGGESMPAPRSTIH